LKLDHFSFQDSGYFWYSCKVGDANKNMEEEIKQEARNQTMSSFNLPIVTCGRAKVLVSLGSSSVFSKSAGQSSSYELMIQISLGNVL